MPSTGTDGLEPITTQSLPTRSTAPRMSLAAYCGNPFQEIAISVVAIFVKAPAGRFPPSVCAGFVALALVEVKDQTAVLALAQTLEFVKV
jgi:hypothetical protein